MLDVLSRKGRKPTSLRGSHAAEDPAYLWEGRSRLIPPPDYGKRFLSSKLAPDISCTVSLHWLGAWRLSSSGSWLFPLRSAPKPTPRDGGWRWPLLSRLLSAPGARSRSGLRLTGRAQERSRAGQIPSSRQRPQQLRLAPGEARLSHLKHRSAPSELPDWSWRRGARSTNF